MECEELDTCNSCPVNDGWGDFNYNENIGELSDLFEYEQRINELDRWHNENTEAISLGQFYRENYSKKYREWQT